MLYDGFLGFALGGLGAGTQILDGNYRIKNEIQQRANAQKVLAKTVAQKAKDPETVKAAEAMAQKLEDGEMLTTEEVETLDSALEAATQAEEAAETVQQEEAAPAEKKPLTPVEAIVRVAQGKVGNESEKLNIDNTANRNYTENINSNEQGGVPNDSNRVDRGMVEGVPEGQFSGGRDAGGRQDGRGYQGLSRGDLTQSVKRVLNDSGVVATELKDYSADSTAFSNALTAARAADAKNGWAVSPQDTNELQGKHLLMDANGTIGLAITSDGDVEAVFKNKALNKTRHAMDGVMPQAIAAGGLKLDCYGKDLVRIYEQYGFTPVARVEFNPEYANEGWTPDKGTPYIYFMMNNGDSAETVAANIGKYSQSSSEQLEALPTFGKEEYDEAYAYRDELLAQQQSNLPEGMGAASAKFTGEMTPVDAWIAEAQGNEQVHNVSNEAQRNLAAQQHRAPQDVPLYDKNGKLTRAGVEAVINSGITDAEMSERLIEETYNGTFSYDRQTDVTAIQRAKSKIEEKGYDGAVNEYLTDSYNGKVTKDTQALGITLLNKAIANKDYNLAVKLTVALAEDGTNSAQALQARRILNKMSPEGKLYAITQLEHQVTKIQRDKVGKGKIANEAKKINNAVEDVKQDISESLKKRANNKTRQSKNEVIEGNQAGEPFIFEYEQKVGEAVAKAVENKINSLGKVRETQPFMKTVINNLTTLANQLTPRALSKPNMTATERIADYMANKEFYDNAWAQAQIELLQRYEGNEDMLARIKDFTSPLTTGTTPLGTKTMIKALAETAMAQMEDAKTLAIQNALNIDRAANVISDRLISDVEKISGVELDFEAKETILRAAEDYVQSTVAESKPTDIAQAQIRDVMRSLNIKMSEVIVSSDISKAAVAEQITNTLTTRWGFGEEDASAVGEVVQEQFAEMMAEAMGKKLESIYSEKERPKVKTLKELFAETVNLGAFDSAEYANKAAERFFGVGMEIDGELAKQYVEALEGGNEADIKAASDALLQSIAEQITASWVDKLNAWRYLSMLLNPQTHIRNFFGSALFAPFRMLKNVQGAALESVAVKEGGTRTKAVLNLANNNDRGLLSLAWRDYTNAQDAILSGAKYDDSFNSLSDYRTIYKVKPLETLRKKNTAALEREDSWFCQSAYAESLAQWLKANGYTADRTSHGIPEEARAYAIKEAQKATYRDINWFSTLVSKLRIKTGNQTRDAILNIPVEGLIPFRKTPANILARAAEYSPLGLAKALTADVYNLKNGNITANEFIDNLSAGLTGTELVGLGILLAKFGLLTGGADDDDKQAEFDSLQGKQNYSITIGDTNITLSWLAPESMPVFVGVEIYNRILNRDSDEPFSMEELGTTLLNLSNPMLEMSMLDGVNSALEAAVRNRNDNALVAVAKSATSSYISQFAPTLLGKLESISNDVRQTTFKDSTSGVSSSTQYALGKLFNKVPGIDYQQVDYIDAWGRTQSNGSYTQRLFDSFINPAYTRDVNTSAVEMELQRLYDGDNSRNVFPTRAEMDTEIDKQHLTAEEYTKYATKRGQEALKLVNDLINSSAYRNMSDADKADTIENLYKYADEIAKKSVKSSYEVKSWVMDAQKSNNPAAYIADRSALLSVDTDGNGRHNNVEKVKGLAKRYSGAELVDKVREYMSTDKGNCELADMLENAQAAGVADSITLDVYAYKTGGHKKAEVEEYIYSKVNSAAQRSALYYSLYKK